MHLEPGVLLLQRHQVPGDENRRGFFEQARRHVRQRLSSRRHAIGEGLLREAVHGGITG